ncbi:MAG: AAA family ATPase [Acidimicrobiales bacterium]
MPDRFLAADRRRWIAQGKTPPPDQLGAVLFLDISGFTPLTNALAQKAGRNAAEELGWILSALFTPLIEAVAERGGSVVTFAGDALSCWFGGDDGRRAGIAALRCQQIMLNAGTVKSSAGERRLEGKVSVAVGPVVRMHVGDPNTQLLEAFYGEAVDRAGSADKVATAGDVVVDQAVVAALSDLSTPSEWRESSAGRHAVLDARTVVLPEPDPAERLVLPAKLAPSELTPWVHARLREILVAGTEAELGENRPAVTMFLSFSGIDLASTESLSSLDEYVTHVQAVVAEHGGTLLDVSFGDKGAYALAAFGVPQVHSDDPIRALAAAESLRAPPEGSSVKEVRIGLATGETWTGVIGSQERCTYAVIGDSVNVSARLMDLSEPGEVLLAGDFTAAEGRFELWPMPAKVIKGHPGALTFELVGPELESSGRLQPRSHPFPMIARGAELALARARLDAALAGSGGMIHVTGGAGLGKSRLTHEIVSSAISRGFRTAGSEGHSYETATPYFVWRRTLRMLLGVRLGEEPSRRISRLVRALESAAPQAAVMAPLFAPLLGIDIDENETSGLIPPAARKEILRGLMTALLGHLSADQPILVVIEDAQWIDSLSRELLDALAGPASQMPLVLVLTERTNGVPPMALAGPVESVTLHQLAGDEMSQLFDLELAHLFGISSDRPQHLGAKILEQADGNPLFCGELLRDLHERGVDPRDDVAADNLSLPGSVQRVVLDRLDRLPAFERQLLRLCSAVGKRVPHDWLAGIAPQLVTSPDFPAAVAGLVRAEILEVRVPPDTPAYVFANATLREAIYESLGLAVRRDYHASIAHWLETLDGPQVELLVHHYRYAEQPVDELRHIGSAGEQALKLGAFGAARDFMRRGLELIEHLPAGPERATMELRLQLGLGAALIPLEGHRSSAASVCYRRANELTAEAAPGPDTARAMFGLWTHYLFSADLAPAVELAEALLFGAQMSGQEEAIMQSHLAVSLTTYWRGDLHGTVAHARECVQRYDPAEAAGYVARYSQNPRITAMTDAVWATWMLGDASAALQLADDTLDHANALGHPWMRTIAMQVHPVLYAHTGDVDRSATTGAEFLAEAEQMGNPVYVALATVILGWVAGARGSVEQGLGMLLGVREGMRSDGVRILDPLITTLALDVCVRNDRPGEGLSILDDYLATTDTSQHRLYLGEQMRLRAELMRMADSTSDVDALLDQAEALAREIDSPSYLLRVQMTRRALGVPGPGADPLEAMQETLQRLSGCGGTPDVKAAQLIVDGSRER